MDQLVGTERRERLLDAGQRLMVTTGFAATSIDRICAAAGVTKGAFFHYFPSKEALAQALVQRFAGALYSSFQSAPFRGLADARERLVGYVECTKRLAREPILADGCLLGIFSQELATVRPEIAATCAESFTLWAGDFQRVLDDAKESPDVDTARLARHFIGVVEGALILSKALGDRDVVDDSLDQFLTYALSVLGPAREGSKRARTRAGK